MNNNFHYYYYLREMLDTEARCLLLIFSLYAENFIIFKG